MFGPPSFEGAFVAEHQVHLPTRLIETLRACLAEADAQGFQRAAIDINNAVENLLVAVSSSTNRGIA